MRALLFCFWFAIALAFATAAPARASQSRGKIAIVVLGDPDEDLREAALALEEALTASEVTQLPADAALRAALRGEPGADPEDGLERARSARRELGFSEARDAPVLASLGQVTGAVAIVVVQRRGASIEAIVFDVGARSYYEGALPLEEVPPTRIRAFVEKRAASALARASLRPTAGDPAIGAPEETAEARPAPSERHRGRKTAPELATQPPEETKAPSPKRWIARGWPYLVGGLLLAGTISYFALRSRTDDPGPPVLRWSPGGGR